MSPTSFQLLYPAISNMGIMAPFVGRSPLVTFAVEQDLVITARILANKFIGEHYATRVRVMATRLFPLGLRIVLQGRVVERSWDWVPNFVHLSWHAYYLYELRN